MSLAFRTIWIKSTLKNFQKNIELDEKYYSRYIIIFNKMNNIYEK